MTEIYDKPHVSPDRRFVFVASPSVSHNVNGMFLWEITPRDELSERVSVTPEERLDLYYFQRWVSNR